jgi:predicted enzyme related to lactoylglutathione lyase
MITAATTATDLQIPVGAPCWMDLVSSDVDASATFYAELFGWTVRDAPPDFGGYRYFELDGRGVGGLMANQTEWCMPDGWSIYLRTDDVAATAAAAREHGGTVLMEPMDVVPNGSFAILRDAGGAIVSGWQPGTESGFGVLGEVGSPRHFELHTRSFDAAVAFYRSVFGWGDHLVEAPGFRYATYADMSQPRAGIMDDAAHDMPEEEPHWAVYLGTENADGTVERAVSLGATVLMAAEDTPYGRLAVLRDPTGAEFRLQG